MATTLKEYSSLEEKRSMFTEHFIVNDKHQLRELIDQLEKLQSKKKEKYLFRGVSEAKYKLYTSFQRLWIDRDLNQTSKNHIECIAKMINKCSVKDSLIFCYYKRLGVICNDWLILSFLQHYGAATPLLDFSRDPYVALFFACDDISYKGSAKAIDHYVSIYYYKAVNVAQKIAPSIYKIAQKKASRYANYAGLDFWKTDLSFTQISSEYPICIIPAYSNLSSISNETRTLITKYTVSNLNSTVQNGEFICNVDEVTPLEELLVDGDKKYLTCIDIHKGLVEHLIEEYLGGSIAVARKKYYPDEKEIAKQVQTQMLSEL